MNRAWKRILMAAIAFAATASAQTAVTTSGGTSSTVPVYTGSSTLGDSPVHVSGSNVGIGTTNPGSPLEVNGSAGITGGLTLNNLSALPYSHASIFVGTTPAESFNLHFGDNDLGHGYKLNFHVGSTTKVMTLQDNGYVGIGTSTPSQALEVNGNIRVSGSLIADQGISSSVSSADPTTFNTLNFASAWGPISWGATSNGVNHWGTTLWSWQPDTSNNGANLAFATGNGTTVSPNTNIRMLIDSTGNIGVGTNSPGSKLEVNGNIKLSSGSGAQIVFADSSVQSVAWTGVLSGGDYAESVDIAAGKTELEPGDLIVIDHAQIGKFAKSSSSYSTLIGGVYATKPGVTGRRQPGSHPAADEIPMAMVGIVPTKVSAENGPIHQGDLLVSSSTPGYAMKGTDREKLTGAVLGKALGTLEHGAGVIEVLISLQ